MPQSSARVIRDPLSAFDKLQRGLKEACDGCFEWQRGLNDGGYGVVYVERQSWMTHRLMYQLVFGGLPKFDKKSAYPTMVCHRCDNPKCCNPKHLYLGTAADNAKDMAVRCRVRVGYWRNGDHERQHRLYGTVYWEIDGVIRPLSEWSHVLSVNSQTLDARLRAGWARDRLEDPPDRWDRHRAGKQEYRRFSGIQSATDAMNVLGDQGSTTTGPSLQAENPAVVSEHTACQGGVLFTQAKEQPR